MESFEALFAKIGIIANGLIGSAVFNGNYMFSQQGVDQNGAASSHYENFSKNSSGATLVNPYDSTSTFKPNFCINFETGEVRINARGDTINSAISNIAVTNSDITATVQEMINGALQSAGITITSEGVFFHGSFVGNLDGDIAAKSFSVLNDANVPVLRFDTYKEEMGTPEGGVAPEVGTPVIIISHGGKEYLVNALKLVTGTSTANYQKVSYTEKALRTTASINKDTGNQGYESHKAITSAPYLRLMNNNGQTTSTKIQAKLYASDGTTEVQWSSYLNKYYSGTLVSEYPDKTDIGAGIWAFKITGSLATTSGTLYNGIPTYKYIAMKGAVTVHNNDWNPNSGGSPISRYNVFTGVNAYIYNKISITNGVLSTSSDNIVTSYNVKDNGYGALQQNMSSATYVNITGVSYNCHRNSYEGEEVSSKYFATSSTTGTSVPALYLNNSAAIVGPQISSPPQSVVSLNP